MADSLSGLTEVSATVEEIVSTQIQEVLTSSMVVPPTIMDFSAQVGPGMDTLKIPRFSNFTVDTKSENTAVDAQVNAFSTDDLPLDKHQVVQFLLEDIASLQAKVAVAQAYINQIGRDLAAKMDSDIITAMLASPSAAAPDHLVQFDNNPTDTLSKADFLEARRLLSDANNRQDDRVCLISPTSESEVLAISEFVRVDESGSSGSLRNGQIGKLFGFDVLVSSQQSTTDGPLFYHTLRVRGFRRGLHLFFDCLTHNFFSSYVVIISIS